jgi:hypothetical protein
LHPVSWFSSRSLHETRYHGNDHNDSTYSNGALSLRLLWVYHIYGCLQLALLTSSKSHLRHCLFSVLAPIGFPSSTYDIFFSVLRQHILRRLIQHY